MKGRPIGISCIRGLAEEDPFQKNCRRLLSKEDPLQKSYQQRLTKEAPFQKSCRQRLSKEAPFQKSCRQRLAKEAPFQNCCRRSFFKAAPLHRNPRPSPVEAVQQRGRTKKRLGQRYLLPVARPTRDRHVVDRPAVVSHVVVDEPKLDLERRAPREMGGQINRLRGHPRNVVGPQRDPRRTVDVDVDLPAVERIALGTPSSERRSSTKQTREIGPRIPRRAEGNPSVTPPIPSSPRSTGNPGGSSSISTSRPPPIIATGTSSASSRTGAFGRR